MRQKNFFIFLVLAALVVAGWIQMERWLWPRKDRPKADAARKKDEPLTVAKVKAQFHFPAVPLLPGAHPAFGLLTDLSLGNLSDRERLTASLGDEVLRRFAFPSAPLPG